MLLTSLALATAGTGAQMRAQEPTARLVKDVNRTPGVFHSGIFWVMPVGTAKNVVFPMDTLALGQELYTSDGTPKGTRLLKDLLPGPDSDYLTDPAAFGTEGNAKVAFLADAPRFNDSVWATDGTEAGTVHVFESQWQQANGGITMHSSIPGGFFFEEVFWGSDSFRTLYFSDGTAAGTWPINPQVGETRERFSSPRAFITSGSVAYFIANNNEVWRCDGTPAGTSKVVTIPVGSGEPQTLAVAGSRLFVTSILNDHYQLLRCPIGGGDVSNITPPEAASWEFFELQSASAIGDDIFFVSYELDNVRSLWASDGFTTGTRRIPLVHPGASGEPRVVGPVVKWKGSIYLRTRTPENNYELWRSNGTEAGTVRVKDFANHSFAIPPHSQENSESLVFNVTPPTYDGELLWQTKGDEASTQPIKKTPDSFYSPSDGPQFALAESGLIFSADQSMPEAALYRVKGPKGGAIQLTQPESATGDSIPIYSGLPYEMLGGNLLQIVETGKGLEIWKMKPDGKGARSVWKVPGTIGEYPGYVSMQGTIPKGAIFTLYDGEGHHEVWITNGTRPGTRLLSQHETLTSSLPPDFLKLGDTMFYSIADEGSSTQRSLWKTDGTPAGTSRVLAADGISHGPFPGEMVEFQGFIYYFSNAEGHAGKTTFWRTDGTTAGTTLVKDGWPNPTNREKARSLSVVGGKLYFAQEVKVNLNPADVLWESDGTTAGTVQTTPEVFFKSGGTEPAFDLNGVAVFRAYGLADQYAQWWRHSENDTSRVRTNVLTAQLPDLDSRYQAVVDGKLFYRGKTLNPSRGEELWVTDGTDAGTHLVKDINPGYNSSAPVYLTAAGNAVYFNAWDDEHGYRLWRSDGTEAGTVPAANFGPGTAYDIARGLKPMFGKLYFHLNRRDVGDELHSIDLPDEP